VRVGCNPLLAASFVSTAVDQLSRCYPRVVFRLVTGYVETLHRELTQRNVDLLIARRFSGIADEQLDYEFCSTTHIRSWWARKIRGPGGAE
jgi:DNA-binding transcriptional LysR family regulator